MAYYVKQSKENRIVSASIIYGKKWFKRSLYDSFCHNELCDPFHIDIWNRHFIFGAVRMKHSSISNIKSYMTYFWNSISVHPGFRWKKSKSPLQSCLDEIWCPTRNCWREFLGRGIPWTLKIYWINELQSNMSVQKDGALYTYGIPKKFNPV